MPGDNVAWANNTGVSKGLLPGRRTLGPLFLITMSPPFVILLWLVNTHFHGSALELYEYGVVAALREFWPSPCDPAAWRFILAFTGVQLALTRLVPGKRFEGPVTPMGNVPVYKANGLQVHLIGLGLFIAGAKLGYYNGGIIYDVLGPFLSAMNISALIFCLFLYVKGVHWPSSSDSGVSGNVINDYWNGSELYPRILGFDIKTFVNGRFSMQFWSTAVLSFAWKAHELHGAMPDSIFVSAVLQIVYLMKFFLWETGYWTSIDIMHDRAGFMIIWGCLAFVPSVYTNAAMWMVERNINMGPVFSYSVLFVGVLCIWANYDCDRQRQHFRKHNGKAKIWGREPTFIEANYVTETGEHRTSLLLVDGWWAISRHFNYVPELGSAFCWCFSAGFHLEPLFYFFFLTLLLVDRAERDSERCSSKYGAAYEEYKEAVPARLLPGIY